MMVQISNYLPIVATLSPVTVAGIGLIALSSVLYLVSRAPEFLMVAATAMMYSVVPLIPWH